MNFQEFSRNSTYISPVDFKKLRFIWKCVQTYLESASKSLESLRVLEIGCGKGGITIPLSNLGCTVVAFDIDRQAIDGLRQRIGTLGGQKVKLEVNNGYTFDDGLTYDIVIASEIFEHVVDPSRLAANIIRRMGRESILIVTIPNGYGPWELKNRVDPHTYLRKWNFLRLKLGKSPYVFASGSDHCQFYSRKRFLGLFSGYSLKLLKCENSDFILTILRSLRENAVLGKLDSKLANHIPPNLASGWYFQFQLL